MSKINIHFNQASEGMTLIDREEIEAVVRVLKLVREGGGTVYLCGNGGSHATASHFANDLVKMGKVRAVCVGDSTPITTAYGNDEGWAQMYSEYIRRVFQPGDMVIGISCSGNSMNVINALQVAKESAGFTVGLTGLSKSSEMSQMDLDAAVYVPVPDIRVQEDLHLMICHAIVRSLQEVE